MLNHIFVEQRSAVHSLTVPYFQFKNISLKRLIFLRKKLQHKAESSSPSLLS